MPKRTHAGFTLLEFLIILALVAILLIIFAYLLSNQYLPRAEDSGRKTDIERLKVAFEDYYNDKKCYPPPEILDECGGNQLAPYLEKVPCDRQTHQPYFYEPNGADQCSGYRLLGELQYKSDPVIVDMPCYYPNNYGISVGEPLVPANCMVGPSPSPGGGQPNPSFVPTLPSFPGQYACDPHGECNVYSNPMTAGCPRSYKTAQLCVTGCKNPKNYCPQ